MYLFIPMLYIHVMFLATVLMEIVYYLSDLGLLQSFEIAQSRDGFEFVIPVAST